MARPLPLVLVTIVLAGCMGAAPTTSTSKTTLGALSNKTVGTIAPCNGCPENATGGPVAANGSIDHVFVIILENEGYNTSFGPGAESKYLGVTLPSQGVLLPNYFAIGHDSLDNYIAMVSGQPPTIMTQGDCPVFADFESAPLRPLGTSDMPAGQGCVYPPSVLTIGNELDKAGLSWKLYGGDMAAAGGTGSCRHPAVGSPDPSQNGPSTDSYALRHVPFVYFHAVIDNAAECNARVVDLSRLGPDLLNASATPALAYIVPNTCDDGHDDPCQNGTPGGYPRIDAFLRSWVPRIEASPAFAHGLLVVTFDEGNQSDTRACCGEVPGPNTPAPGLSGPGGGQTGAVLVAPCLAAGTVDPTPYNHYSFLRTVEDLFHVPHLGESAAQGLIPFKLAGCST
ncbi:MAG: alkaline phosphatase family protein [Thermoplasmatota archaeon]